MIPKNDWNHPGSIPIKAANPCKQQNDSIAEVVRDENECYESAGPSDQAPDNELRNLSEREIISKIKIGLFYKKSHYNSAVVCS